MMYLVDQVFCFCFSVLVFVVVVVLLLLANTPAQKNEACQFAHRLESLCCGELNERVMI